MKSSVHTVKSLESSIISLLLELLGRMELWRGRIGLLKSFQEPCRVNPPFQSTSGQMFSALHAM